MATASNADRRSAGAWVTVLAASQLIISIDYNIVVVALPAIARDLGFSTRSLQWVIGAYAVAWGGLLLLGGRAADRLGRRRMLVGGLVLYAAASLAGALSAATWMLVAARALQGAGAAAMLPATLALINTLFAEGAERNRALAIWGGAGASGLSLGALLGGLLTAAFGWRSVLWVNVPVAAAGALAALAILPADAGRPRPRGLNLPGALLATTGSALLVFALVEAAQVGWSSPVVPGLVAVALGLLAGLVVLESRRRDPLIPLRLLAHPGVHTAGIVMFVFQGTFAAVLYFLTLYFQRVHDAGAVRTGLQLLPLTLITLAGTQGSRQLIGRADLRRTLVAGQLLYAAGLALLASELTRHSGYAPLLPGIALLAAGNGITWTAMFATASAGVAAEQQGVAAGIVNTLRLVGGAVGLAVLVEVASGEPHAAGTGPRLLAGMQTALRVAAALGLLGAMTAAIGLRRRPRTFGSARPQTSPASPARRHPG